MENNKGYVVCQNCEKYNRCTKKCADTGKYTARKETCDKWVRK